jgi:hypothetical protein
MQGALVAFVGMTMRKNGPRASSPAEAGSNLAVLPAKAGIPDRPQGRSVGLSWMPTFVGMTLRIGRRPPCLMLALDRGRPRPQERSARGPGSPSASGEVERVRRTLWTAGVLARRKRAREDARGPVWRPQCRHSGEGRNPRQAAGPKCWPIVDADLRRHDAADRSASTLPHAGPWTAGVLARRKRAHGAPDRLRRPGRWRAVHSPHQGSDCPR